MIRTLLPVSALLGTSSLMLVDSAIKGAALLLLAGLAALMLRRDSAATRHLVWLVAIVAMLAVPLFSAMLPGWRVVPAWRVFSPPSVAVQSPALPLPGPKQTASELVPMTIPVEHDYSASAIGDPTAAEAPLAPSAIVRAEVTVNPAEPRRSRLAWLPLLWAAGCSLLILRLIAARWMLWSHGRRGAVIAISRGSWDGCAEENPDEPIVRAFQAACRQLGVLQPVHLLIHSQRTIPVVWGTIRPRLLLPAAARHWSPEQLKSVLLHELAHIKRRDTVAQLLAQIACALHWFNPLAWFAAWRLHVERERACDDLVLASGVRASAYAEHLLDVATRLSSSPWTGACGLAMARSSSLEGRLRAVLSNQLNRRAVTRAIFAAALLSGAAISIPIAMLHAEDEPAAQPPAAQPPAAQPPASESTDGENEPPATPSKPSVMKPAHKIAKLPADAEQRLPWGKPVDGLRAALSTLPSLVEPQEGTKETFDLVVQNVSDAPIHFVGNAAAPNPRTLRVKRDGTTLLGLKTEAPSNVDYHLQPREVAVLPMFPPERDDIASLARDQGLTFYAVMQVEQAPEGAWTGKLITGETVAAVAAADKPQPQAKSAQSLFKEWQESARINGKIPGGALGTLAEATGNFVKFNPTDERTEKLAELLKRMDRTRDWTEAEAVALLDDVTAVYDSLPEWAQDVDRFSISEVVRTGQPLPAELESAPWGEAQPNGLRAAWLLDPRAEQHRLGTPLKSTILFHNDGNNTVIFRALTWNQSGGHKASNAEGEEIHITATHWTTIPQVLACRLAPGEYIEVIGAGIGVGANKDNEDWRGTRVGAWIEAKEGDEVTFTPAPVSADGRDSGRLVGEPPWWLNFIKARLERDMPLPDEAEERKRLVDRAVRDLFGMPPTPEESATFIADRAPDALDQLANRLAIREGTTPFTGTLQSGETIFRVLAVDPDAAKKPRVATGPGRYTLGELSRLVIVRKPEGERIVNEASIRFFKANPKAQPPGEPREIKLPDGYHTWAIAWQRGSTVLWVAEKGVLRSYDFTNSAQVKETRTETTDISVAPETVREALRPALETGRNAPPAS